MQSTLKLFSGEADTVGGIRAPCDATGAPLT
jgi:hypothetical protein